MEGAKGLWKRFLAFHGDGEGPILKEQDNKPEAVPRLDERVSANLYTNIAKIKEIYHYPESGDLILRNIKLTVNGQRIDAFLYFFDGLVNSDFICEYIISPLMQMSSFIKPDGLPLDTFVEQQLVTQNAVKRSDTFERLVDEVSFGGCGLFVDGVDVGWVADTKGWPRRGVGKPDTDKSVLGPQESFTELIRGNTALLRKTIRDPNLVMENMMVGKKSKTAVAVVYIKNLANASLVEEVKRRIGRVNADYIFSSEELEHHIEDSNRRLLPQMLSTERPDRTAAELADGNIAIIVNGSPYALILPATFFSFLHTNDDRYLRMPYANFVSILRYLALTVSVLLPGLFVVVTQYHHEIIPTDLLFALEASFEKTPFPLVFELIMLEVAFELIREAEIKFPSIGGSSVGIVGGLILGQAAVTAGIVSPIVIIVVAMTAVGSMSAPSYSMGIAFRIMRFSYIILGAFAGMLGVTVVLFCHLLMIATARSFGVRGFAPIAPRTREGLFRTIFVTRASKFASKPDYNNSKQEQSEHNSDQSS